VPTPTRHRAEAPVALVATVAHPAGPLPVVVACLEFEPAYNDDRAAQAQAVYELVSDPALDGALPVVLAGDLNATADSPCCARCENSWSTPGRRGAAIRGR
jgi:endonuclease/exonuclease/phosphatase family metal-dependent hydrolase